MGHLSSLLSQLEIVLSILSACKITYPSFSTTASSLSLQDSHTIIFKLVNHCTYQWKTLGFPLPLAVWKDTIHFITHLDWYISTLFSFLSLTPEGPPISSFSTTSLTAQPSVSDQVIIWEVTVDPSILVLQNNYYYPLAPQTSQHPSSENLQAIMSETTPLSSQGTNPSKQSAGPKRWKTYHCRRVPRGNLGTYLRDPGSRESQSRNGRSFQYLLPAIRKTSQLPTSNLLSQQDPLPTSEVPLLPTKYRRCLYPSYSKR